MLALGGGDGAPVGPARDRRERGMLRQEQGGVGGRDDRFGPVSGGRYFFSFQFAPDRIVDSGSECALWNIRENERELM